MNRIPLTITGYAAMQEELKRLKTVERPGVIRAIAEARAHGDLSENAEYAAARERQGFIEGRIQELEGISGRAEVIDPGNLSGPIIQFGATVCLVDQDNEQEAAYQIVGEYEAEASEGRISVASPLARAMIGKQLGDFFEFHSPSGTREYEVTDVTYG